MMVGTLLRGVLLAVAVVGAVLSGGCSSDPSKGYTWGSTYDDTIKTVSVPVFKNNTQYQSIERDLAAALIHEIQTTTPWRVAAGENASATLSGVITSARLVKLSTADITGLVQEEAVQATVQFEFKDNRTGKVLVARRNFSGSGTFVPAQNVREKIDTGRYGAAQALAKSIVAELRENW
ncbi:MAG: hypothetical protein KF745_01200 [Phycisphaeraceae bacterium]|nr:hypothetical protein [Phycisphaeraceae bacterium]